MPILKVVRTPENGAWGADHFPGFGTVLRAVKDPEGIEITKEMTTAIRLDPSFPRIPANLANRVSDLYIEMLSRGAGKDARTVDSSKEVSVVLLRDEETLLKWRVLVPTQVVGGASVNADYEKSLCDIETGEEVKVFPPPGWLVAGTSHSHNTMGAFFSGTDDRNELPQPGVHFVVGTIHEKVSGDGWTFSVAPSIVYHGKRYEQVIDTDGKIRKMDWLDIVEFNAQENFVAHANCYEYVKVEAPKDWDHTGFSAARSTPHGGFGYGLEGDEYPLYPGTSEHSSALGRYYQDRFERDDFDVIDEIDGDVTEAAFEEWLRKYDKRVGAGFVDHRRRVRPKPDTPVLAYPKNYVDLTILPRNEVDTRDTLWTIRQSNFGEVAVENGISWIVVNPDGKKEYWVPHINGHNSALVRVEPVLMHELTKRAKRQRRGRLVSERAGPKDSVARTISFMTRGVRSEDFTQTEIENMIEAWGSNLKQRSDLRIAIRKVLGNLNDGSSQR